MLKVIPTIYAREDGNYVLYGPVDGKMEVIHRSSEVWVAYHPKTRVIFFHGPPDMIKMQANVHKLVTGQEPDFITFRGEPVDVLNKVIHDTVFFIKWMMERKAEL